MSSFYGTFVLRKTRQKLDERLEEDWNISCWKLEGRSNKYAEVK